MYYVNCVHCGRPVMAYNVCAGCLTPDRSGMPKPNSSAHTDTQRVSPAGISLLAGLVVAGVAYWKTADETTAATAGMVGALFARTSIGQVLARGALAVAGLWLAWLAWTFFRELSQTYR